MADQINELKLLSDGALQPGDKDELERGNFVNNIAKCISGIDGNESFVIGLNGKWGEGKSSVINLLKDELKKNYSNAIDIMDFNPWLISDEEKMTQAFFRDLESFIQGFFQKLFPSNTSLKLYSSILNFSDKPNIKDSTLEKLVLLLSTLGLSNLLPELGKIVFIDAKTLTQIGLGVGVSYYLIKVISKWILNIQNVLKGKTLFELKEDLRRRLKKRNKKLLIIIDDIDRLTTKEIKTLLTIVKGNADFPNLVFLLTFDKDIVAKALDKEVEEDGYKYLEKIVQIQLELPENSQQVIVDFTKNEILKIKNELPNDVIVEFDQRYFDDYWEKGFGNFFSNLRDAKRYLNELAFYSRSFVFGKTFEVNFVDLSVLIAIRLFEPDYYNFLRKYESGFTNREIQKSLYRDRQQNRSLFYEGNYNNLRRINIDKFDKLLKLLFPNLEQVYSAESFNYLCTIRSRFASPKHFSTYFNLLPGGKIGGMSTNDFFKGLKKIGNESELWQFLDTESMSTEFSESLVEEFFEKLSDFVNNEKFVNKEDLPLFTKNLFNFLRKDKVVEGTKIYKIFLNNLGKYVTTILERIEKEKRVEYLEYFFNTDNSLYVQMHIFYEIPNLAGGEKHHNLLTNEEIESVMNKMNQLLLTTKIEELLNLENRQFVYIFHHWQMWYSDDCKNYCHKHINSSLEAYKFIEKIYSIRKGYSADRESENEEYLEPVLFKVFTHKELLNKLEKKDKSGHEAEYPKKDLFIELISKHEKITK